MEWKDIREAGGACFLCAHFKKDGKEFTCQGGPLYIEPQATLFKIYGNKCDFYEEVDKDPSISVEKMVKAYVAYAKANKEDVDIDGWGMNPKDAENPTVQAFAKLTGWELPSPTEPDEGAVQVDDFDEDKEEESPEGMDAFLSSIMGDITYEHLKKMEETETELLERVESAFGKSVVCFTGFDGKRVHKTLKEGGAYVGVTPDNAIHLMNGDVVITFITSYNADGDENPKDPEEVQKLGDIVYEFYKEKGFKVDWEGTWKKIIHINLR